MATARALSPRPAIPRLVFSSLAAFIVVSTLGGCEWFSAKEADSAQDSAKVSQELSAEVTVKAVDLANRLLTLERADGSLLTVIASPQVTNLPQVAPGDKVRVSYIESLVASLKKPGEPVTPGSAAVALSRAEPGDKPAAGIGQQVAVTVTIQSVDTAKNIVVFTRPDGQMRAITVRRPEFQEYIKGLEAGDLVELTYTESIAVAVEEPAN